MKKSKINKKSVFAFAIFMFALISLMLSYPKHGVVFASTVDTKDKSSIIVDYASGEVVYENNADEKLQVASIVKLMTTLLTIEEIEAGKLSLDDMLTATENAAGMGGSQVFIDPFVKYNVGDMLKGVIVASANDAAVALSEHIAGSEANFVKRMNKKAKELGMTNTLYANSTGLPAPEEYSTARDTATILKEVIKHDIYHKYSKIWMDELVHPSGRKTEVVNTNKLSRYYQGCDSGKTGFTDEAGYCLVASAKREGLRFIAVSLGAKDTKTRFANVTNLLNYAFANFENKLVLEAESAIKQIEVKMSKNSVAAVFAKEPFYILNKKGEEISYELQYNLPTSVKAPLANGDSVGSVTVIKDGKVVAEIDLIVKQDHAKFTFKDAFGTIVNNWN